MGILSLAKSGTLVTSALQLTVDAVLRDGDLFGVLLNTFVLAQLRGELQLGFPQPRLYHLRDQLGERFVAGVVLHTGTRVFPLEERIIAAPVIALWS